MVSESEDNLEELKRKCRGFWTWSSKTSLFYRFKEVKENATGRIGSLIRFTRTNIKPGDISHEVVHVADNLYSFIGKDTDEDYRWITNKIYGYE